MGEEKFMFTGGAYFQSNLSEWCGEVFWDMSELGAFEANLVENEWQTTLNNNMETSFYKK